MNTEARDQLIAKLADHATDNADTSALKDYFFQGQVEILDEKEDNFLIDIAIELGIIDQTEADQLDD